MFFRLTQYFKISFYILTFTLAGYFATAHATTDQQAIRQQQILQHQQEQQRQFREQQQNLRETQNIRDSRVREGVVEDGNATNQPITAQNKCDVEYNKCINKCNQSINNNQMETDTAKDNKGDNKKQCIEQCAQTRTDCISELEATCPYRFNQIILKGNEVYSTETLNKKIVNSFLNRCISKTNITDLQSKLTNFYINNGYTMARIYFDMRHMTHEKVIDQKTGKPIVNQKTGKEEVKTTFIVIIEEGLVNSVKLNVQRKQKQTPKEKELTKLFEKYKTLQTKHKNSANELKKEELKKEITALEPQLETLALQVKQENLKTQQEQNQKQPSAWTRSRQSMQTAFAFPFKRERVFNMRDFEQGLDQMNRLQSNSITMSVEPTTAGGASGAGYTDVIITNNQDPMKNGVFTGKRTTFLTAGVNNSGSKNTGENVISLSLSQDNLISINDNIYISYTDSSFFNGNNKVDDPNDPANKHPFKNTLDFFSNDEEKQRYSKSLYSNISFPIGYWTINNSLNYSTYKTTNSGQKTIFHTTGETITQSYSLDRVMYRTQKYKLNAGTTLEIRDTESYIRDLKSDTGSKKTSSGSIYINNTIFTKYGTIILKPSYQRGLSWFGSKMDEGVYGTKNVDKREMHLQYDLIKLYVYYNTRFNFPLLTKTQMRNLDGTNSTKEIKRKIKGKNTEKEKEIIEQIPTKTRNKLPITYTLTADSQYSFNPLYGKDQFSVGGEYTVRGFRESSISGDNGFYFRNDLRVNVFQLLPDFITGSGQYTDSKNNKSHNSNNNNDNKTPSLMNRTMNYNTIFLTRESLNSLLSKTYLSIFYDYGYVRNKYNDTLQRQYNARSGYLSGFGIGLNYYGDYLNWSLTYSKAIHSPQYLQTRDGLEKENHSVYWRVGVSW